MPASVNDNSSMGRIEFRKDYNPPTFRKIAFGTWRTAADPSVYGQLDVDMSAVSGFLEKYSAHHGVKVTPTHLFAYVMAKCMLKRPEINGMIRWGRIYLRKHVSVFFQVNVPGSGKDGTKSANLSGVTLENVEDMTLKDIAQALAQKAGAIRNGEDRSFKKSFALIDKVPWILVRHFLDLSSFLLYVLNWDLSKFGLPRDPFGSVMITNVGGMGIDLAWAPLCPYSRVPLLLTIGAQRDRVVAIDGQPQVRPVVQVGVTFDHRFMDGVHAAEMSRELKKFFAEPEQYFS